MGKNTVPQQHHKVTEHHRDQSHHGCPKYYVDYGAIYPAVL